MIGEIKDTDPDTEELVNQDLDGSSTEGSGPKIKRRPGETKEQAIKRIEKAKELKRLQKLMQYAFPRQREAYLYKKKLLPPEELNRSVDLM